VEALKRWIDRRAIAVATRMMARTDGQGRSTFEAAELLGDPNLLRPPEIVPRMRITATGEFDFPSAVNTGSAELDTVRGKVFRVGPERPTVILVHGWNAELHYLYGLPRVASSLNARGFNAILIELPYHLRRRPARPARTRDFISDDLKAMLEATRQAIADFEGLARWARAEGSSQVALWGFSLGGWLAGLHVTQSSSLDAAVLTTPISALKRAIETLPFCFPVREALAENPLPLERLDLFAHRPRIGTEKILVVEANYDEFVPSDTYRRLAAEWGLSSWQKVAQSHISILLSRRAMARTMDWLEATMKHGRAAES
jgi:dienelactone hydrolase